MSRTFTAALGLLALLSLPAHALAQTRSAQDILAASDEIRNPPKPFALVTTLTEYRAGKPADRMVLKVYSKTEKNGGQYRTLIRFLEPERDRDKLMLKEGNTLWFYDPAAKSTVRLSPQQRLLGQASNGDVVTVNLARDYAAKLGPDETITDGDRQPRDCVRLDLDGTAPDVTYAHIELWVDKTNDHPVKGKFYSDSGRLLKIAFYRRWENQLGRERPTETVIIDGIDTNLVTRMQFSEYAYRDIPDDWYQRDFLPRFQGE
jgi:outer membrane lipoprotein-sorting protein